MRLRLLELEGKRQSNLAALIRLPTVDIFDEADEILRHNYQLIYAIGDCSGLAGGVSRWNCAYALLRILRSPSKELRAILSRPQVATMQNPITCERFAPLQLIASREFRDSQMDLRRAIADELVSSPPHCLEWIMGLSEEQKALFVDLITNNDTIEPDSANLSRSRLRDDEVDSCACA
jgi:hypothetical protein